MVLRVSAIERSLLIEAVRLLERAAQGEDVRGEAERFVSGLEIGPAGEIDETGKPVERIFLRQPRR